jgi:bifunctional non-homologous end joining protein LigD
MSDPMPRWIPPKLAKLSGALPLDDAHWAYEVKWDGIRALSFIEGGRFRIMTRNQIEVTKRYPELHGISDRLAKRC